jgi:hypothetical protein
MLATSKAKTTKFFLFVRKGRRKIVVDKFSSHIFFMGGRRINIMSRINAIVS